VVPPPSLSTAVGAMQCTLDTKNREPEDPGPPNTLGPALVVLVSWHGHPSLWKGSSRPTATPVYLGCG
jgi:hypothetical protein